MAISNGAIPASRLARVDGGGWSALLAPGAAAAWLLFVVVVVRLGGRAPRITAPDGAYRSLARQVWYWVNRFRRRVSAARPGSSNHGLGMAIDIANYLSIPRWILLEAASRAGFRLDVAGEPWHMHYTGAPNYTTTAGIPITVITEALMNTDYLYLFTASGRFILLSIEKLEAPIDTRARETAEGWTLAIPGLPKAKKVSDADADRAKVMSSALRAEYLKAAA